MVILMIHKRYIYIYIFDIIIIAPQELWWYRTNGPLPTPYREGRGAQDATFMHNIVKRNSK